MTDALYPPAPALADTKFLLPSSAFKAKTYRMILGIVLFILLYIMLVVVSIGLLLGGIAAAYYLVTLRVMWITLAIGISLIAFGVMCFIFTIKFIFSKTVDEQPLQVEIKRKDHPVLFEYIEKLSKEVGTQFPKKIYLTPDVNASVSYNSSFWSMFFPVRKNLRIGLGLVNTLTLSEFKATMAHEFGHFSQRSMKTGSYVYTMNKIIYNLAYQQDQYDETLRDWASRGGWFGIFISLAGLVVQVFRAILRASYQGLNVTYMALSREMEYHADLIACSAAGNEAIISTLRKIEYAGAAYDATLSGVNSMSIKEKKKVSDIYSYHSKMMNALSTSVGFSEGDVKPRVIVKDQWASHPSRQEREANINTVKINASQLGESAWVLFNNPDVTRKEMTQLLYADSPSVSSLAMATETEIDNNIDTEIQRHDISPTFCNVYDLRWISKFDIDKVISTTYDKKLSDLLNPGNGQRLAEYRRDLEDFQTLSAVDRKMVKTQFFEFDGVRHKTSDARRIMDELEDEIKKVPPFIQSLDEDLCRYYYQRAKELGREDNFLKVYKDLAVERVSSEAVQQFLERINGIANEISTRGEWHEDDVKALCRRVSELEVHVKNFMRELPTEAIGNYFAEPDRVAVYLERDSLWNRADTDFNNESFAKLYGYINSCANAITDRMHAATRAIFAGQLSLTPAEFVRNR